MTYDTQYVGTRRMYFIDLSYPGNSDWPLSSKPIWSEVHKNPDGSPAQFPIARLETSTDGQTARIEAKALGSVTYTVTATTAVTTPPTAITLTWTLYIAPQPQISGALPMFSVSKIPWGPLG